MENRLKIIPIKQGTLNEDIESNYMDFGANCLQIKQDMNTVKKILSKQEKI